jgi:hypothetical protein
MAKQSGRSSNWSLIHPFPPRTYPIRTVVSDVKLYAPGHVVVLANALAGDDCHPEATYLAMVPYHSDVCCVAMETLLVYSSPSLRMK